MSDEPIILRSAFPLSFAEAVRQDPSSNNVAQLITYAIDQAKRSGYLDQYYCKKLSGACGFFQSAIGYLLDDLGFDAKRFAVQSFSLESWGHVGIVVNIGDVWYLIDPSFIQFEGKEPVEYLLKNPAGFGLFHDLKEKGFAVLTPERADAYLNAFHKGFAPLGRYDNCFDFMIDPPACESNNWHRREFVVLSFSKFEGDQAFKDALRTCLPG